LNGLKGAKGIVGFQLVRLEKADAIKEENDGPGGKSDESPEAYFAFGAGNRGEFQGQIPPLTQV
jgi:hypothetical protein